MIKVYKPGEKRKSVVVLRSVRRVAVTSCERGTPVCVVMTHGLCGPPRTRPPASGSQDLTMRRPTSCACRAVNRNQL